MARTRSVRRTTGAAVAALATVGAFVAPAAAAPAVVRKPLTAAASAAPAALALVGRSTSYAVVADRSNGVIYAANPGGRAAARVIVRGATPEALSGDLLTYRLADGTRHWRLLGTSRSGTTPAAWAFLAPDGGMRVRTAGSQAYLDYLHLDGTTQTTQLPASIPAGATYSVVASPDGVAVAASTASGTPKVVHSTLGAPLAFTALNTAGLPAGATLRCTGLTQTAVGCIAPRRVVRVSIGSTEAPQVTTLMATPRAVAVTDGYTSWTTPHSATGSACPCDLVSLGADGSALAAISGLTSSTLVAGGGRFFYVTGAKRGTAGAYVTAYAGGGAARIQTAPARPLTASVPALGPGRAAWVDDSGTHGPVRSAAVAANAAVGTPHRIGSGASLVPVAVSGLRTLYTTPGGALHRIFAGGVGSPIATGTLVSVSGTRALYRARNGHLIVLDLVARRSLDVTAKLGARSAALWGDYLSFGRADGSIWRATAAAAHPVRLAAPTAGTTATRVVAWGDWTAWAVRADGTSRTAYRNARTLATARAVPAGRTLTSASAGGLLVAAAERFELRAWSTGAVRTTIEANTDAGGSRSATAAPSVDGGLYVALVNGRPTVGTLGVDVTNRPRSLGNPYAPAKAKRGSGWRFELPTSAVLKSCAVVITRGSFRTKLPCSKPAAAAGEVLARWRAGKGNGKIPPLRYRWTVRAAGADGSVLAANGGRTAPTGTFVLS